MTYNVTFTLAESGTRVYFSVDEQTVLDEITAHRTRYMRLGYTLAGIVVWR